MPKLLHAMVRVAELDRSIRFYHSAFDLKESHRLDFADFTLVYLRNEATGVELELTLNKGNQEPYTHGTGYGHIAFGVEDLESFHAKIDALGYAPGPIKALQYDGQDAARFFFMTDPDGYKIEVLARQGHYM